MELSKKQFYIISAILILLALVYIFFENPITRKKILDPFSATNSQKHLKQTVSVDTTNETNINPCLYFRKQYKNLDQLKKEGAQLRFINIHKKINNDIYRLRQFYKEANEGEQLMYLLYKEDQNSEDHLIEKSAYKKGPKYLKIEKQTGEVIFTEEALTLGEEQKFFLQFTNKKLTSLQGIPPEFSSTKALNCQFNKD